MTWEQKVQACQVLGEVSLRMRKPGDWYVNHYGVERAEDGCLLSGGCVRGAKTPQDAVEQHWEWLTVLKPDQYIVTGGYSNRRTYRWEEYMWVPYSEAA